MPDPHSMPDPQIATDPDADPDPDPDPVPSPSPLRVSVEGSLASPPLPVQAHHAREQHRRADDYYRHQASSRSRRASAGCTCWFHR
jgi:hypothetical protein